MSSSTSSALSPSPSPDPATDPAAVHFFDQAVALRMDEAGLQHGRTHPGYQNMVGPYGGITAATLLQAVMNRPERLGEPIALTVNFAGPVADGPFEIDARALRTNRTTQHWAITQTNAGSDGEPPAVASTATVVTALRRPTWAAEGEPMPAGLPTPEDSPRDTRGGAAPPWISRYDMRPLTGALPREWDGREQTPLMRLWLRDEPPRPLDFAALAALCDNFYPMVWLRRAKRVMAGTVSMSVYFHASTEQLAATGSDHLLAQARGQGFRHGFFDHSGQVWNRDGLLLATTHQIVYYKE